MFTIKNLTKRIVTLNVPELGTDVGTVSTSHRDPKSGVKGVVDRERAHARSITLMPKGQLGDTSEALPDCALESVEIKNMRTTGGLLVTPISAPPIALAQTLPEPGSEPAPVPNVARALRPNRASTIVASPTEKDS